MYIIMHTHEHVCTHSSGNCNAEGTVHVPLNVPHPPPLPQLVARNLLASVTRHSVRWHISVPSTKPEYPGFFLATSGVPPMIGLVQRPPPGQLRSFFVSDVGLMVWIKANNPSTFGDRHVVGGVWHVVSW